ncbi:class I SAM-dependent methyltransferase [Veillonella sp.]|uniref:tRNA (mnm(5)s(2)U34)-methyltransferase n=1 Tax=Veillonella sp. TaxID=1926307 RepID=UPI0025FB8E7C|nr:class I SAM-dependent methyltransferase [Veillonella sp.]
MINYNHVVQFQHIFWDEQLKSAKTVVDATAGNGHDLVYLAQHCLPGSTLWGIDKQAKAIEASTKRLRGRTDITYHLVHGTHEDILATGNAAAAHNDGSAANTKFNTTITNIDLLIFNLGYLPGSDHTMMTKPDSTIQAIKGGLDLLNPKGLITIVTYPGTPEGEREDEAVCEFISTLPQKSYDVANWKLINQANKPPILYIIKGR